MADEPNRSRSSFLRENAGTILTGGVVVGGLVIGAYAISKLIGGIVNPGPPGGPCDQPGTPCYTAAQPWLEEYNTCLAQYNQYLTQFLKQDSAAGTGVTSAQQSILDTAKACMDDAALNLGRVSGNFTPTNPIDTLAGWIGPGVFVVLGAIGAGQFYKAYKTAPKTGSAAANVSNNGQIQALAESGQISPASAAALKNDVSAYTDANIASNTAALYQMASAGAFSAEEAAATAATDEEAMLADQVPVLNDLGFLGGFFGEEYPRVNLGDISVRRPRFAEEITPAPPPVGALGGSWWLYWPTPPPPKIAGDCGCGV